MIKQQLLLILLFFMKIQAFGNDTLYVRLSNPWNTKRSPTGDYLRKCVKEQDYYHTWDYNRQDKLVVESFYTDTSFTRKLFCHKYFNKTGGYLEQTRCYENGQLNGYNVSYASNGDTVSYAVFSNGEVVRSWSREKETKPQVFQMIEVAAEFPGGLNGWRKYLSENLTYPAALKEKLSGNVHARVYVDKTGTVTRVEILKSLHPLLDAEVVRVMKNSPKWKPAWQNGKAVSFMFTQPVTF